jgi:hypothetical protein
LYFVLSQSYWEELHEITKINSEKKTDKIGLTNKTKQNKKMRGLFISTQQTQLNFSVDRHRGDEMEEERGNERKDVGERVGKGKRGMRRRRKKQKWKHKKTDITSISH